MSHQRYLSHDPIKEPHSVSVKVLRSFAARRWVRLSCPSLVSQYPIEPPFKSTSPTTASTAHHLPGSLAYRPNAETTTNPAPFLLSPILNLPVSFGSAYVGETFSCTLCANNDLPIGGEGGGGGNKQIRDVRIEAEMKTPGLGKAQKLTLGPTKGVVESDAASKPAATATRDGDDDDVDGGAVAAQDLPPGATLQKIVSFDLKEEGNHVLAVTVSYYEATETSGRTRTFRKLYQFICKASLIVRTKVGVLQSKSRVDPAVAGTAPLRRWLLEAQLENCSDDTMQLDRVVMDLEPGLSYRDCNWTAVAPVSTLVGGGGARTEKPVLHPGEVEQVCFVVEATSRQKQLADGVAEEDVVDVLARATEGTAGGGLEGRILFGVLGIGWRGEMGNRGFLSTGKLGTRVVR